MKIICELNDKIILGRDELSSRTPRKTARAIVKNSDGLYAIMHSLKFGLYSLPGGGAEDGEEALSALHREILEETGCTCDSVEELGIVYENRASLDYTQVNYYYIVHTDHIGENHLTDTELENKTLLEWHTFDEIVHLINDQEFDRVQQKYLKARDVAALNEYSKINHNKITTPRLTLASLRECDLDALMSIFKSDVVKATYMLPDLPTREDEIKLFQRLRYLSLRDDRYVFGIYLDGKLIGLINDCEINNKCIEIGYALHPAYHNRGFATEAFGAVIEYLFSNGFEEILAGAFEENAASMRVMEKCGMKRTKMTAEVEYRGKTHKCVYYSIKR
ncbi:MAG: GNAT family N-acetyltransferase [Clostridia bacterium]|nr:GNAT family N-acetyltransferase [Clostridia bacterium]